MAYEVQTVTLKGAELLAAASAADRLILAGCAATQTFISQADAINVSTVPADPYSTTTKVNIEGSENNHLFVYVLFVAGESTGGDCKSLYIYGHKESDPTHDYVLAVLSSNTPFHLPIVGEVSNTYGTSMDFVYAVADGAVSSIDNSAFVTRAEFDRLYDRAVTTHAYGTPTIGEAQTIYGQKTFKEKVSFAYAGNFNDLFLDMTSSDYNSKLYGNSTLTATAYGPTFYTVNGGLSFTTSGHRFDLDVREGQDGGSITNAYKISSGGVTTTLGRVSSGASYTYDGGTRYQNGNVELEAKNAINAKRSAITLNSSSSTSNINVVSENINLSVPKINGSEDGLEFDLNTEAGGSVIKVCVNPTDKSDLDTAHGISVDNTTTVTGYTNIHSTIESLVDPDGLTSYLNTNTSFSTYFTSIRSYSTEDEAVISLVAENVIGQGDLKSTLKLTQGNIQLITTSYNDPTKECNLTFCIKSEQNKLFYLYPSAPTNYKVDLGDSSHKFGTIYADTYAGTVEQASKDGSGNTITSTYIKSIEDTSSLGIKCTKGDNTYSYFQIKESLADAVSQPDSYDEIGTIRLARFELKSNRVSQWGDSAHYFRAGSVYKNGDTVADTLGWWGELKELSCGLALYTDKNDKLFYGYSNEFDGDSGTTITFPNSLTGEWKILNAIYDNQFRGSSGDVPLYYWIVLVVKIGSAS